MISMKRARLAAAGGIVLLTALGAGGAAGSDFALPTFEAHYDVAYKGRNLGDSVHTLTHDPERGVYRFESVTQARGLARVLRWRPIIEHSEFTLSEERIRPLEYAYEDGTRKGEDNVQIEFDWDAGRAAVTTADGDQRIPLEPGVLDRAALQIELMRALEAGETPGPYMLADGESLKRYRYTVDGHETVEAGSTSYEAVKLAQHREGSSRVTLVWAAPELGYLPVRIEQRRDGETLTALELSAVDGL